MLPDHTRVQRHRRYGAAVVISLGMLMVFALGGVLAAWSWQAKLDRNIERIPALVMRADDADPPLAAAGRPGDGSRATASDARAVNFLLLGTDSRISAGDPTMWELGAQRTDAIMLVQLAADREALTVMSIPRDSWVEIPGHGVHKVNAAFSFGGPALTVDTIEGLTGVQIDHVGIADFESFAALTDELGGVDITLQQSLAVGDTELQPGEHRLTGEQALHYARERYNVAGGDFGRVQRHQNWMRSIFRRAFDDNLLANPARLVSVLELVTESVAVDESFSIQEMRDLLLSARNLRARHTRFITAPYVGTGWSPDGRQSIVLLDEARMGEVSAAFVDGSIAELLDQEPDIAPKLRRNVP